MAVMADGILYVDNTTLSAVASCDTKAMMQYGYNLKPAGYDNVPADAGSAMHQAIECYYMGGTVAEALKAFETAYYQYSLDKVDGGTRLGFYNLNLVLNSWFDRYPVADLPYEIAHPDHIEIPFDIPLTDDGSIHYVGRIDARVRRNDGADVWYVLDTKTTGRPDQKFHNSFEIGSQMTGYCWAEWQLSGRMPAGVFINIVHAATVPTSNGKCYKHKAQYHECGFLHPDHHLKSLRRTETDVMVWWRDAIRLAEKWRDMLRAYGDDAHDLAEVSQNGKWIYQQCALCEFRDFCRANRPVDNDSFEFISNDWVPGDLGDRIAAGEITPDPYYNPERILEEDQLCLPA